MDPNATLSALLAAVAKMDVVAFRDADEALAEWNCKGGFAPDELKALSDDLRLDVDTLHAATGRRDDDEAHDGDDTLDFRLYIRPDGALDLQTGDAQYDTDHRGYCGAGTVSSHDDDDEILAALLSAFGEACDSAACALPALPDDDDDDDDDTLTLHHPADDGTHTVNGAPATLDTLRALYFRLVSYAMEPPMGYALWERFDVDGRAVSASDTASLVWLHDMLTRHGVSL
jgi:hypothetical protein